MKAFQQVREYFRLFRLTFTSGTRYQLELRLRVFHEKIETDQAFLYGGTTEFIDPNRLTVSGRNLVIWQPELRVEVDPYHWMVTADGLLNWIETNYGGHRIGWRPDQVAPRPTDDYSQEEVPWSVRYHTDNLKTLHVYLDYHGHTLHVAVNSKEKFVIVWDAAIKGLLNNRYEVRGPGRPLPKRAGVSSHRPSNVVSIMDRSGETQSK